LQYATKIKYTDLQNNALNELSDLYEQTGDYEQAVIYFKKHRHLNEAVYSENSSKNVAALQTKYETTQKENRILQQQFEISRRNYWVAASLVVLVLGALLSYSYYKRSQLKQQNIATNAIMETEEKERKRIAQDLHDSVSQLMMAAKINLTVVASELQFENESQKNRYQKAINLVDEGFKEVRTISHNMMPQALLESGLSLVIKQFVENIENDAIAINFFSRGFEEHFDDTVETILYRILQECINNVMKHANATRVDISLIRDDETISLTIEDNGGGFDTAGPSGHDGMGLKNMRARVNFLKGKIEFDSQPGKGTLVSVYIPAKR
jgi:signal transduction histidine kinase